MQVFVSHTFAVTFLKLERILQRAKYSREQPFKSLWRWRLGLNFSFVSHCLGGKLFAVELTSYFRKPIKLGLLFFVAFKNLNFTVHVRNLDLVRNIYPKLSTRLYPEVSRKFFIWFWISQKNTIILFFVSLLANFISYYTCKCMSWSRNIFCFQRKCLSPDNR